MCSNVNVDVSFHVKNNVCKNGVECGYENKVWKLLFY